LRCDDYLARRTDVPVARIAGFRERVARLSDADDGPSFEERLGIVELRIDDELALVVYIAPFAGDLDGQEVR